MKSQLVVCCESRTKSEPYVESLLLMGVRAEALELLTPESDRGDLQNLSAQAAGLVLCGGPDLATWRYGETPRVDADLSVNEPLDQLDWDLIAGAQQGKTPVWAICRGMQIVNVFQGGTLWQDLPSQMPDGIEHRPDGPDEAMAHTVHVVAKREKFGELLDDQPTAVNSRHHQAVKDLGKDLLMVAESPDGVAEVLVLESGGWWVKGVQWHPENLMHLPLQRQLWEDFLRQAESKMVANGSIGPLRKEVT